MDERSREILGRLSALLAVGEAQIKANPIPYIDRVLKANHELMLAFEDASAHLDGITSLELATDYFPEMGPSIVETCTIRNRKAQESLGLGMRRAMAAMNR